MFYMDKIVQSLASRLLIDCKNRYVNFFGKSAFLITFLRLYTECVVKRSVAKVNESTTS